MDITYGASSRSWNDHAHVFLNTEAYKRKKGNDLLEGYTRKRVHFVKANAFTTPDSLPPSKHEHMLVALPTPFIKASQAEIDPVATLVCNQDMQAQVQVDMDKEKGGCDSIWVLPVHKVIRIERDQLVAGYNAFEDASVSMHLITF